MKKKDRGSFFVIDDPKKIVGKNIKTLMDFDVK